MKITSIKTLMALEMAIILLTGLFSLDFLPRNYNEFQRICSQAWSTDIKQYNICLEPYFNEIKTDKYIIGIGIGLLIITPVVYILGKNKVKK